MYNVVRCISLFSKSSTMLSRFLENISFGLSSAAFILVAARQDVIYVNTWPLFAGACVGFVAWLRRIPYVATIRDIYPESLVVQNRIKADGWVFGVMRWMDRLIVRKSASVIVVSEQFSGIYVGQRGIAADKVHVVPSWVSTLELGPPEAAKRFRDGLGISWDAFVMLYGGNIGAAAGVEAVIESMRSLREIEKCYLVVAGSGSNEQMCRELAGRISPNRVRFHAPWLQEETMAGLQAADVLLLPTRSGQTLASLPSKLITYMLSSRPVIAIVPPHSETAELIRRSGCGWVASEGSPDSFVSLVREVYAMPPAGRDQRGLAGRRYALEHFTSEVNVPRVIQLLTTAARPAGRIR
jgi:glycosyltransferase involved in cell wall biosynthesis